MRGVAAGSAWGGVCRRSNDKESEMIRRTLQWSALAASFALMTVTASLALVALAGLRAEEAKPSDEGKAAEFKGKKIELKEKGSAAILLTFAAGKEAVVTEKGEKKTDVNMFIYDAD